MHGLKICLWIAGIGWLLSMFGMFLPVSTLSSLAKAFGGEAIPDLPQCAYAVRVVSAVCVGVGIFFVILALNLINYAVLVPFSGLSTAILGIICLITGIVVEMPLLWFLCDSLSCLILGILIFVYWRTVVF
jgi:hypothetical protein